MKRSRFAEEQIIGIFRQAQTLERKSRMMRFVWGGEDLNLRPSGLSKVALLWRVKRGLVRGVCGCLLMFLDAL